MLTANDIRDIKFSKAMGGYKQEEVDNVLDKVEVDYVEFFQQIITLETKINSLNAEISEYRESQASLQNVLISAQQLADKLVKEAEEKAVQIIAEAKNKAEIATQEAKDLLANFDEKLAQRRENAEKVLAVELQSAEQKKAAVEKAIEDAVARQQSLFDKTRIEVAVFKRDIIEQYKRQVELIAKLPDCVAMDAERAAQAVSLKIDEEPDVAQFTKGKEPTPEEVLEELVSSVEEAEEIIEPEKEEATQLESQSKGFVVSIPENNETVEEEEQEEEISFNNKFFSKSNSEE